MSSGPGQKALLSTMAEIVKISQSGNGNGGSRSRVGPAIIVIVLLAMLAAIAPYLAKHRGVPATVVEKLEAMTAPAPPPPTTDMRHNVWVNRRSGLYYCHESRFYGRMQPGTTMRQESALLKGFRPATGEKCP